ncbi:MAG: RNA polymerase sigma factor, partial [Oscillospiraceae bacterium]|nr:RNA polymerase sigma factor [Oscillospiraceae bacterium]
RIEDLEVVERLHSEIAYLSKIRRQIVIMHYFESKRQQEIADILGLPLGTVKWHLSDAKNELKKGLDKMKTTSVLKFNPIEFSGVSTNGSAGSMGGNGVYLRSALAQNILFLTRSEAMTVNDIADALGVSPVYIESEVEFLEQNVFMLKQGKGYIANVLIDIPTTESNRLKSEVYEKAADMFAPALFDALTASIESDAEGIYSGYSLEIAQTAPSEGQGKLTATLADLNFALWALVPYTIARSGTPGGAVTFEEAATIRPDGGVNICNCSVKNHNAEPIKYSASMSKMGGPSWNGNDKFLLWLIDTEWGGNRVGNYHPDLLNRDLASLKTMFEGPLSEDDIIRMTERGYLTRKQVENGTIDTLKIVWLTHEADKRLRGIANSLREKYKTDFEKLKSMYISDTPEHMQKAQAYGLQHMFLSDGIFIIYVLNKLVESGKLKLPTEEQKNSLGAVVVTG